jgi:hypothetical protein
MKPPEPFYARGEHIAIDLPGAQAVFTTRRGGHSGGPYASLNLGRLTDDDPRAVQRNRDTLEGQIHRRLTFVRQVHGASVDQVTVQSAERARRAGPDELSRADGQATSAREVALAALTADCLPIAVGGHGAVAMLHAGWRGLRGGVIDSGVAALRELGVEGPLGAAIGPGAGPCCYRVGAEVLETFGDYPQAQPGRGKLDLKAIAAEQLARAGVGQVHDLGLCTICADPTLLFSHRRDRGVTGRQAGVAWLS